MALVLCKRLAFFFFVWHCSDLHVGHDFRVQLQFTDHGVDLHLGYDGLQS